MIISTCGGESADHNQGWLANGERSKHFNTFYILNERSLRGGVTAGARMTSQTRLCSPQSPEGGLVQVSLLPVGVEAQLGSPRFPVAPPHPVVGLQNLAGYPADQKTQRWKREREKEVSAGTAPG